MANKTVAELTAAGTMDGSELLHVVQGGNSRKVASGAMPVSDAQTAAIALAVRRGHLWGLTLANNSTDATNDIDVAAGECASDSSSPVLMTYAGATGRQLDVAYGTGNGARFDTSISDGTWHSFIISNGTTVGFGLSKSLDPTGGANYPSGYTHYRRVSSVIRASSAIKAFIQRGDDFSLVTPVLDIDNGSPGTSANTGVLASVPDGIVVEAKITAYSSANGTLAYVSPLATADVAPSLTAAPLYSAGSVTNNNVQTLRVLTNTSRSIRYRASAATTVRIATLGWLDDRGRCL